MGACTINNGTLLIINDVNTIVVFPTCKVITISSIVSETEATKKDKDLPHRSYKGCLS